MSRLKIKEGDVHIALIKKEGGQESSFYGLGKDVSLLLAEALVGKPELRSLFDTALEMHDNYLKNTLNA